MEATIPNSHGLDTDHAKNYFTEFLADPTFDFVDDTFEFDVDDPGEAADALLAAELVAAAIGRGAAALPEDVRAAVKKSKAPNKKVLQRARTAVRSVLEPSSSLRVHWSKVGTESSVASVNDLLERLT